MYIQRSKKPKKKNLSYQLPPFKLLARYLKPLLLRLRHVAYPSLLIQPFRQSLWSFSCGFTSLPTSYAHYWFSSLLPKYIDVCLPLPFDNGDFVRYFCPPFHIPHIINLLACFGVEIALVRAHTLLPESQEQ